LFTSKSRLQAARIAAMPEIWHARVRAALTGFAEIFKSVDTVSGSQVPVTNPAQMKAGARLHLRTLALCARLAAEFGMPSGVDIIIAALCRVAMYSLQSPYVLAASSSRGTDSTSSHGSNQPVKGKGMRHSATSPALFRATSSHQLSTGGNSGRPQPPASQQPHQTDAYSSLISFHAKSIADDFSKDLRAQMALSAALAIAHPRAQGMSLCVQSWKWLMECLLRLTRAGIMRTPQPYSPSIESSSRSGNPTSASSSGGVAGYSSSTSSAKSVSDGESPDEAIVSHLQAWYATASVRHRHTLKKMKALGQHVHKRNSADSGGGDGPSINSLVAESLLQTPKNASTTVSPPKSSTSATPQSLPDQNGAGLGSMLFGWLFGGESNGTDGDNSTSSGGVGGDYARTDKDLFEGNDDSEDLVSNPEWAALIEEESSDDEGGTIGTRRFGVGGIEGVGSFETSTIPMMLGSFSNSAPFEVTSADVAVSQAAVGGVGQVEVGTSTSTTSGQGKGISPPPPPPPHQAHPHHHPLARASSFTINSLNLNPNATPGTAGTAAYAVAASASAFLVACGNELPQPALSKLLSSLLWLGGVPLTDSNEKILHQQQQQLLDDGSAFISGLESARYKCALLPHQGGSSSSSSLGSGGSGVGGTPQQQTSTGGWGGESSSMSMLARTSLRTHTAV